MLPMLTPQNMQGGVEESRMQPGATPAYFPLDPNSAAKQMAALTATSQLRRSSQSGGTSDTTFGPRHSIHDGSTDPATMAQQQRAGALPVQPNKSRRDDFLRFVANVMNARHTPLPPAITGIPSTYDPSTSYWKFLEPGNEPGEFKLAGKDVDLFRLWTVVISNGGKEKLAQNSTWGLLPQYFGLPEEGPDGIPMWRVLQQYYSTILGPFEDIYFRNVQQQQQKALQARQQQQQQNPGTGFMPTQVTPTSTGMTPPFNPQLSALPRSQSAASIHLPSQGELFQQPISAAPPNHEQSVSPSDISEMVSDNAHTVSSSLSTLTQISHTMDAQQVSSANIAPGNLQAPSVPSVPNDDPDAKKRKFQDDELGKRTRQRTDSNVEGQPGAPITSDSGQIEGSQSTNIDRLSARPPGFSSAAPRKVRRKIEYVPLAREVDTYGGHDLDVIESELLKVTTRRSQRPLEDWGTVDIEGLTMSIRSRLPTEVSYAIAMLTILSTLRGQSPDQGFALHNCDGLLEEILELLKEIAFGEDEDSLQEHCETFWIHRDLVNAVRDTGLEMPTHRYHQQSNPSNSNVIFAILNILRNFSLTAENQRFMGQHPDLLGLLLRSCAIFNLPTAISSQPLRPVSALLTPYEVVKTRKEILTIMANIAPFIDLSAQPPQVQIRLFELLASFLVDSHELCSPAGIVMQSGAISAASVRPPSTVDLALEAFSKLTQPDSNRLILSKGINTSWLWSLFTALVHRLPVSSEDFAITMRMHEVWLSYLEKVVLSIYAMCFLATPELKLKIKTDRTLSFPKLILRMVRRFVTINHPEARQYFLISSRRAIEALKLIDDNSDPFESPQSSGPLFPFGMGWGETDAKQVEVGTGLLAAFQDDVLWQIMTLSHIDEVMFAELDSLSRISL